MNRFGLLLVLWVAVGLTGGMPAEGRRAARRARVDVAHPELELEHSAGPVAALVAPPGVAAAVARPSGSPTVSHGRVVREPLTALSSSVPGDPAALPAGSRAPPVLA
jgi:hypothetical protein